MGRSALDYRRNFHSENYRTVDLLGMTRTNASRMSESYKNLQHASSGIVYGPLSLLQDARQHAAVVQDPDLRDSTHKHQSVQGTSASPSKGSMGSHLAGNAPRLLGQAFEYGVIKGGDGCSFCGRPVHGDTVTIQGKA